MTLTQQQIASIKSQLKSQVESMPADKKAEALDQIDSLSPEAVESLLKQQSEKGEKENKTVFRMIVDGDIPSVKIIENKYALAVLDINPISKGHIIIIPRKPVSDAKQLPTQAFSLAKKLAKKITSKLTAKSTEIQTEFKFNESIINLIPCYNAPLSINSPRNKSSVEELEKIAPLIREKPKIERIKIRKQANSANPIPSIKRRIP